MINGAELNKSESVENVAAATDLDNRALFNIATSSDVKFSPAAAFKAVLNPSSAARKSAAKRAPAKKAAKSAKKR